MYRILGNSLCRKKVDVRNRTLYKVVAMLSQQRREMAVDYLMQEKPQLADAYLDSVNKEYADDPSLIYHEAAEYFYYWKLYKQALVSAAKALAIRPYYLRNIGTFLYILRKKNFHSIEANKRHYTEVLS